MKAFDNFIMFEYTKRKKPMTGIIFHEAELPYEWDLIDWIEKSGIELVAKNADGIYVDNVGEFTNYMISTQMETILDDSGKEFLEVITKIREQIRDNQCEIFNIYEDEDMGITSMDIYDEYEAYNRFLNIYQRIKNMRGLF